MTGQYSSIAGALSEYLYLRQPPVAVCFADVVSPGMEAHAHPVPAGCRFWEDGAKSAFATTSKDHETCAIGVYTHNLKGSAAQKADLQDALGVFSDLGYVRSEDLAMIPVLRLEPKYIVYSPLAECALNPDVVLLFVDASQTLILAEATQQVEQQIPPAMGRPACAVIPQVMNTGRAALSLGCCGARAYLDILTDEVAVFGIPGAKIDIYARSIEVLAKANSVLTKFHGIRRKEIEAGRMPSVRESLNALSG